MSDPSKSAFELERRLKVSTRRGPAKHLEPWRLPQTFPLVSILRFIFQFLFSSKHNFCHFSSDLVILSALYICLHDDNIVKHKASFLPNMFVFLCAFLSLANIPPHKHSAMVAEVAGRGWCGWDCENILIKSMLCDVERNGKLVKKCSSGNACLTWRSIRVLTHIPKELLKLMIFNFFSINVI